tara:strand:+ start:380 stop:598 length:219 start_codon:yes stop_codon:yes gene_type:complete
MIMSSKDVVDALAKGKTLDAEDAFKNTMKDKVANSLETKKVEVAQSFVRNHLPDETESEPETETQPEEKDDA